MFLQDEQVWPSRGDGGVPDVVARFQTNNSTSEKMKRKRKKNQSIKIEERKIEKKKRGSLNQAISEQCAELSKEKNIKGKQ